MRVYALDDTFLEQIFNILDGFSKQFLNKNWQQISTHWFYFCTFLDWLPRPQEKTNMANIIISYRFTKFRLELFFNCNYLSLFSVYKLNYPILFTLQTFFLHTIETYLWCEICSALLYFMYVLLILYFLNNFRFIMVKNDYT